MRDHDVFLEKALLAEKHVTKQQLNAARQHALQHKVDLADALTATGAMTGRDIALIRADVCEVPYVNLADYEPCYANTALLPRSVAERITAFPMFMLDGVLTLAMDDPLDLEATDQVREIVKCEVDPVLAEREQLNSLIAHVYSLSHAQQDVRPSDTSIDVDDVKDDESSQPVIAAVNHMLSDASDQRASDIHINPDQHDLHLRYRVDGVLQQKQGPPLSMHAGIVQRLKVMAHLDLTQTRRPQDGKFRFRHGGCEVDVRLSTMPTVCGENVVLRLLASNQSVQDFHDLGMSAALIDHLEYALKQPYGMVLVSGPTGSGKTTTLYAALNQLNDPSRNIMTIEDPVEIRLPYVRQIQTNAEIGLTFATALRSILRQDPDVVLVGEIRDQDTAAIALQAALTGHLVLSTVHTNDAVGVIARLRDFGMPPFVINSAVLATIGQRLVRRVCQHCVAPDEIDEVVLRRFNLSDDDHNRFVRGKGCSRCGQTGYRGRLGIYEILNFTPAIQQFIEEGASVERIRAHAVKHDGMRRMADDGLDKARLGQTTIAEIAKAVMIGDARADDDVPETGTVLSMRKSA